LGAASYALSRAPRTLDVKNTPGWNVMAAPRWHALVSRLAREGFDPTTVHVVTAAPPLALVSASRAGGRSCLIVARSGVMGATVCGRVTSLVTFTSRGHFDQRLGNGTAERVATTSLVGIAPAAAVSVQQAWGADQAHKTYTSLLRAPQAMVFGETLATDGAVVVTARGSSGRVVARKTVRALPR
jgi:hypothetical protein